MKKELTCKMFGGEGAEQYNALMSALELYTLEHEYADGDLYTYIDATPKTTLIVNMVEALHKFGYEIKFNKQLAGNE